MNKLGYIMLTKVYSAVKKKMDSLQIRKTNPPKNNSKK